MNLQKYFSGEKKHIAYEKTVEIMNRLKTHANGEHPSYHKETKDKTMSDVITETRPNEDPKVKDFRVKIYVPITKSTVSKIFSSFMKIRKSDDWNVKYNQKEISKKLNEGESLFDYMEIKYPYFGSLTNWAFNVGLKHYGIDPNGVVCVMPLDLNIKDGEFFRPYNYCFESDRVYEFIENESAILYSHEKSTYVSGGKEFTDGNVFFVVDKISYQRWEQTDQKGGMTLAAQLNHGLGELPVFKNKGIFYKSMDKVFVWESRLDPIVPRLTEAAREFSELQGDKLMHLNPEKWVHLSQDCSECNGSGSVIRGKNSVQCSKCMGYGKIISSAYQFGTVRQGMPGETPSPWPPATYVLKPVEIIKILGESVKEHLYEALSSINMQFMVEVPLNTSGKSKEVDRDELNNFVNGIAEDLVYIMDKSYYFSNELRNKVRIPNKEERLKQLPSINVPDKFDLIGVETSLDMIIKGRTNNLSPELVTKLELEFAEKQFCTEPEIKNRMELVFTLDPFSGTSEDIKDSKLASGGITELDYIISSNIEQFVQRAIMENENFFMVELKDQKTIIENFAKEKQKQMSAKEDVMTLIKQSRGAA